LKDNETIFQIKGYLDALARINSACFGSDLGYIFEFDEFNKKENIIFNDKHFFINDKEEKKILC